VEIAILCVVFNHGVPPTTQKREQDTKGIEGSEIEMEKPECTKDSKNLLHIG